MRTAGRPTTHGDDGAGEAPTTSVTKKSWCEVGRQLPGGDRADADEGELAEARSGRPTR